MEPYLEELATVKVLQASAENDDDRSYLEEEATRIKSEIDKVMQADQKAEKGGTRNFLDIIALSQFYNMYGKSWHRMDDPTMSKHGWGRESLSDKERESLVTYDALAVHAIAEVMRESNNYQKSLLRHSVEKGLLCCVCNAVLRRAAYLLW